ncbi:hypothetical protein CC85DRAFT_326779 [Cutaneotrichosporon oleaginosum]|uniref:Uncharacterized protein n=1 Tax=Cutaneotrichosporon oleaginosum TaxID=879819 RepID=A0A0J0XSS3_9TREE|nr:uncharacterized protein CC85DRAFT_326779 [Cutaneotrichosporon oleaginosum]KLT44122.1 hypothetical protein CC85DRAFT_326779 [Cutaneotrichosporon oleaginosum]TXT09423.1 hypothetical protein COLE_03357 [Cutaneotrichosporon oleaginosum]
MARIPQMYEVRTHSHSAPAPSNPAPAPATNPFATPNSSVTNLGAPPRDDDRNSTNLSSIGGLLMSSSWDDAPKIRQGRARSSTIVHAPSPAPTAHEYSSSTLHARVQSLEGELDDDNHRSFFSDASGPIAPARVGASASAPPPRGDSLREGQPPAGGSGMTFPVATPSPRIQQAPLPQSYPESPYQQPRPPQGMQGNPQGQGPPAGILQPRPQRPGIQVALPVFAGAAPVSPMLAAPPRAHFSPMVPSPSPSNDNASIRGHDFLREKNATFREGEEEVFTPFSPRARQAGPRARAPGRKSVYSTVDFWKRLSHVARSHEKESSFLVERRRTIWRNPMFVVPLLLTLLAIAAIVVWLVVKVGA